MLLASTVFDVATGEQVVTGSAYVIPGVGGWRSQVERGWGWGGGIGAAFKLK